MKQYLSKIFINKVILKQSEVNGCVLYKENMMYAIHTYVSILDGIHKDEGIFRIFNVQILTSKSKDIIRISSGFVRNQHLYQQRQIIPPHTTSPDQQNIGRQQDVENCQSETNTFIELHIFIPAHIFARIFQII